MGAGCGSADGVTRQDVGCRTHEKAAQGAWARTACWASGRLGRHAAADRSGTLGRGHAQPGSNGPRGPKPRRTRPLRGACRWRELRGVGPRRCECLRPGDHRDPVTACHGILTRHRGHTRPRSKLRAEGTLQPPEHGAGRRGTGAAEVVCPVVNRCAAFAWQSQSRHSRRFRHPPPANPVTWTKTIACHGVHWVSAFAGVTVRAVGEVRAIALARCVPGLDEGPQTPRTCNVLRCPISLAPACTPVLRPGDCPLGGRSGLNVAAARRGVGEVLTPGTAGTQPGRHPLIKP